MSGGGETAPDCAGHSGAHTPGPWEVGYLDHAGQRVVRGEHIEICTCWHHSVGSIEMEMEANARLIAAAPDLLAALREARAFLVHLNVTGSLIDDIDAAIRKATQP